jgi:23S rRNA (guanosine2251-2'-O)-methyltransferase
MSRHQQREPRVVFGFHAVLARLRADPASVIEIFLDEARNDARAKDLAALAQRSKVTLMRVPVKRLDGFYGGARHQGVVARVQLKDLGTSLDEIVEKIEKPLVLVLDGVTDPHNLGACLRVANAAGAHAVVAPKDRAAGISATVSKVASGAAEATPYLMVTNLARTLGELKERNIWIVGADERAERTLYEAQLPDSIAWVLGAEGEGMRRLTRETCDLRVRIPMGGDVQSLNVSVAAGVCLFESVRRRMATGKSYVPPDPTRIEDKPEALDYWSRTLETDADKLRRALRKVGGSLEKVKQELGIAGV